MTAREELQQQLQRWVEAGLLDSQSAERIRSFETSHESPGMRWPVVFAIAFGSIMVAAGILLFVAAHWEDLSPTERFLLVMAMISVPFCWRRKRPAPHVAQTKLPALSWITDMTLV